MVEIQFPISLLWLISAFEPGTCAVRRGVLIQVIIIVGAVRAGLAAIIRTPATIGPVLLVVSLCAIIGRSS